MKKVQHIAAAAVVFLLGTGFLTSSFGQINDLVKTPPMGWNSWNVFHENINEKQIKEIADAMVTSGMRDAGYIYLNLDDNWMAPSRDGNGDLRADPTRFPSGMKALGDYIHAKGLKFGIYGDRGIRTCHHFNWNFANSQSGSYGKEERDANKFASWGVDYLKYDNCEPAPGSNQKQDYERMRDALKNSGRDIVYSICAWGYQSWMPATGNLWRTTGDIDNSWETPTGGFFQGVSNIFDLNEKFAPNASPGGWNDPDMLQIGNGVLTTDESKSHMSIWAIMAAPLLVGNDIRKMNQTTKDILMNPDVIAVNQDSAGIQGTRISKANGIEIWSKPLGSKAGDVKAIALLNRQNNSAEITLTLSDVGFAGEVLIRDLWAGKDLGVFSGTYKVSVPAHGTSLLKLSVPTVPQAPFKDAFEIPGIVQMENYDLGGQGVSYFDGDAGNEGAVYRDDGVDITGDEIIGYKVGWTTADEWLEYTISVKEAGIYYWKARVATGMDTAAFHMMIDGKNISENILVENTGSWDDYVDVEGQTSVALEAGEQILRVAIDRSYLNLDWISFYKDPVSLIQTSTMTQTNNYQVFDIQGKWHGSIYGVNKSELQSAVWNLLHEPGLYIVKPNFGNKSKSVLIEVGLGR